MRHHIILLFSLFAFLFSCQSGSKEQSAAAYHTEAKAEFTEASEDEAFNSDIEKPKRTRQIIKTANYRFEVEDVDRSSVNIKSIAKDFSAYITSINEQTTNYERSNRITIRVPNKNFDSLLEGLSSEAVFVNYKKINSQDVSEEFVDLEIRLKTKKDVRDKYIELLRNKAKTVKDVLAAEEAIRNLTEEIEAKEGRLRYLKNQVGLSTVNLEIYQKVEFNPTPTVYQVSFFDRLKSGFFNGWDLLVSIFIGLVNIWPLLILLTLIIWQWKRIFPFRRKKKQSA